MYHLLKHHLLITVNGVIIDDWNVINKSVSEKKK